MAWICGRIIPAGYKEHTTMKPRDGCGVSAAHVREWAAVWVRDRMAGRKVWRRFVCQQQLRYLGTEARYFSSFQILVVYEGFII